MYHALIRTHHITSRKKVAALKDAAKKYDCYAILRSGSVPGVMYVEGSDKSNVESWVEKVHDLRYKDYQLVAAVSKADKQANSSTDLHGKLDEVENVKDLGAKMDEKGLTKWWRVAMGFQTE